MELDKELYPFKSNYIEIKPENSEAKPLKMHYLDEGAGEVLLMIHGNPTWSFFYRNLVKELSSSYRCIVPDHIGSGLSDKPSASEYSYALTDRAENIHSLVSSLDVKNITLVLHDWGALVGMTYARRHPDKIKRIIVLNSAAFGLPDGRPFPWMIGMCKNRVVGPILIQQFNLFSIGSNIFCVKKKMDKRTADMYLYPYDSWKNRYGVLAFILDVPLSPDHCSWNELKETEHSLKDFADLPMLICWADKDFVFDRHFLKVWTDSFPNATVRHFPNAGHYILEDAGDEVAEEIKKFLAEKVL